MSDAPPTAAPAPAPGSDALARLGVRGARDLVRETWAGVFAAEPDIPLDVWADANRVVAEGTSPEPGAWNTAKVPYAREVMRAVSDPNVRKVVMRWASQLCKSEVLINAWLMFIARRPAPAMIIYPDADMAKEIMRDRLMPNLRETPAAARRLTGRAWDAKSDRLATLGMTTRLVGSHSRAKVASWPICYLIRDELDEFAHEAIGRSEQRTKNFPHRKIIDASTPTWERVGIDREFLRGDQCEYWVPCPHCNAFQVLRFAKSDDGGGVRWEGGLDADPEEVKQSAWYECAACRERIENRHKGAMNAAGVWVPKGGSVDKRGRVTLPEKLRRVREVRSFTLSALYSPWLRFGDVAAGFVEAAGDPPMEWVNGMLGEPYRVLGTSTDADTVVAIAERSRPAYKRGQVLDDSPILTGAIDVQPDCVYFEVLAWRFDGHPQNELLAHSLIDWGRIEAPQTLPENYYEQLRDRTRQGASVQDYAAAMRFSRLEGLGLLDRAYQLINTQTGAATPHSVRVVRFGMDANFDAPAVIRFVQRHTPRMMAVAGRGAQQLKSSVVVSPIEKLSDGTTVAGGLKLTLFDAQHFRDIAWPAVLRETPAPAGSRWPVDYEPSHARQLTAEHRVTEVTKRGMLARWEPKPGRRDNHFWDCRVINTMLGEVLVRPFLRQRYASPTPRPTSYLQL